MINAETQMDFFILFLFLFFILFFCLNKKKNLKPTNHGPPRVSGAREQCKKPANSDLYSGLSTTGFFFPVGPSPLKNPLKTH